MNSIIKGRFSKWIIVVVALGMFAQPVQQVLAAESSEAAAPTEASIEQSDESARDSGNTEEVQGEVTADDEAVKDGEKEDEKDEAAVEDEEQFKDEEETTANGVPEPPSSASVQLPPSTVKQKVADADIASGALVYNYALQTPQGRAGMQPSLSLAYNSQQNEEGSLVGYGWGLDIPTIERKNVDGLNKLYTSENFTSSLSGDLKKTSHNGAVSEFGAKIDSGSFLIYAFDQSADEGSGTWTVKDKTGTTYTFGTTADSRLSNPADETKVFRWHLTRVADSKGNFISYEYSKMDNQVYPAVITYSNHSLDGREVPGIFKVQFNLEDRTDRAMSAKYGFMVTNTKRISNVEVLVQDIVIGRYNLDYGQQSVNRRSRLASVEYEGYDSTGRNPVLDGGMDFAYESVGATDLLTKITQNTGGTTTVTYKPSAQYRDGDGASLNPHMPFAVQTVEKIEYDDRNGQVWQNTFEYAGGWYYYNGPMDRRFVGFEKVVRTDDVGNTVATFYHQGNEANVAYGELLDDWAKAGKVYKSELRDSTGNMFTQALNKWEFDRLPGVGGADDRSFARLVTGVTRVFDGNTTHKDTAATYSYNSDNGNLLSAIEWGQVNANEVGTFTDVGTDKLVTTVSYAAPIGLDESLVGFVSSFMERNYNNQKVKEGNFYFDGYGLGRVEIGNQTKEESWISDTNYASVERTFDERGMPLTETDPLGNVTTYLYDEFELHPSRVTNVLGHAVSYEYDYRLGKPFKTTDPNGLVNKITFDGLGRAVKEEFTQPGQTDPNVMFTKKAAAYELYEQGGEIRGWKTTETNYLDEVDTTTPRENKAITYTDGFDRPVQMRALVESDDSSPNTSRFSVTDTQYNNIAQVRRQSLPYFSDGSDRTEVNSSESLFTTLNYDSAYRVIATTNAVGGSTSVFDDWKVTVTDANGKVKALEKDAYGRLVKVEEQNNSESYITKYEYDALGNLVKLTDALENSREFDYDGLGRRTEAEDLHARGDDTFGVWSYEYDLAGNLVERLDANGRTTSYIYDILNRITEERGGGGTSSYDYDSCVNGIGKLCSTKNSSMRAEYEYDLLGQTTVERKTVDGEEFATQFMYDRQGNQVKITNPDLSEVKYSYNIGGMVEKIESKEVSARGFGDVVVDRDYAPTGGVVREEYTNGTVTINSYDEMQLYRLTNRVTTTRSTGQVTQNLSYVYDPVGNITEIYDRSELRTSKSVVYGYDDLHRLIMAKTSDVTAGENYVQTFEYDAIGNILYKSDVGTYSYDGNRNGSYANPHAVTSVTAERETTSFEYDQNGNMLSDGVLQYTWDYNNRILSTAPFRDAGEPTIYGYDNSGMRVSVISGTGTARYPSKGYNTSRIGVQKHIFAGDSVVATIQGTDRESSLYITHLDHLGSTVVTSDARGDVAETTDYFPFGEERSNDVFSGNAEQRKYIGQEYDPETKLSYLEARYYNGKLGRFLSEDAVHLSLGDHNAIKMISNLELQHLLIDPQITNSYSYSRNNSVRLKDPNGNIAFIPLLGAALGATISYVFHPKTANAPAPGEQTYASPTDTSIALDGLIDTTVGAITLGVGTAERNAPKLTTVQSRLSPKQQILPSGSNPAGLISSKASGQCFCTLSKQYGSSITSTNSHAYKHRSEFYWMQEQEYQKHITQVIANPGQVKYLQNDRISFYDEYTNTLVIINKSNPSQSTAFRPERGQGYVDDLK